MEIEGKKLYEGLTISMYLTLAWRERDLSSALFSATFPYTDSDKVPYMALSIHLYVCI